MNSLDFAVNMELEGQKYYMEQAKKYKENSLDKIFMMLARDEGIHAQVLENKKNELAYELKENNILADSKNIFNGLEDFKDDIRQIPQQVSVYREALEKEKMSIDLYIKFLANAVDEKEKKLFKFLIKQEKEHYEILEQIVILASRPDDWVESAEFGSRDAY